MAADSSTAIAPPDGFELDSPASTSKLPEGFVLDKQQPKPAASALVPPINSDTPQLSQYNPTIGQRASDLLSSVRRSQPVETLLGKTPDETAQMLEPRPTGIIPNVAKAVRDVPKVAELSPADLMGDQSTVAGGVNKALLSQVNLGNLAMLTGIGDVWKAANLAKDSPKIAALTKALVGAYFTAQGAKGAAETSGKVAGNPDEPKGELGSDIAGIGLNSLMAFAPAGEAILSGKVKPFDRSKIPISGSSLKIPEGAQPPTSEQPQPSPDPNIKEVPPETSDPSGGTPLVPTVAAESPVTPKAVDSMPPAQQAALQHGDGIRYGLTLGADDVAELQKKYDETTKQQIAAFQSGDGAAAKAAFGRANFYGGALMGATRGEHKISGSNYDQFLKDNPNLKPSPETAKAAPAAETLPTTTKPVGEQASGGGAESPTVAKSATVQTPPVATGPTYFHGTKADYPDADISTGKKMFGIHLTTDEDVAKIYGQGGGSVKAFTLDPKAKVLDLSDGGDLWSYMVKHEIVDKDQAQDPDLENYATGGKLFQYDLSSRTHLADEVAQTAKSQGYDVVKMPDDLGGRGDNIAHVVVNPKVLRSKQPPQESARPTEQAKPLANKITMGNAGGQAKVKEFLAKHGYSNDDANVMLAAAKVGGEGTFEHDDGSPAAKVIRNRDGKNYSVEIYPEPSGKSAEQPPAEHIGMGAAVPSEFSRGQGSPTAMKYKLIDQERQQRGLEPLAKPTGVSDQAVMDKAMAEVDRDPSLPNRLVSELNTKPRSIDAWERMVLLLHKIDLRHEYEKSANEAAQAYDDSKEYPDRKADMVSANLRTADLSDQLTALENASRVSGSEQGRGLRALRIMANEDYSLASLETQRRAAKGGEPLTDSERADLKKVADDYKKANDELQSHLDKSRASEIEANQRLDEALRQPKPEPIAPHIRALAEKIISASEGLANSARERIKARRAQGRLMTGLDPTDLADHAIVGTDYLLHGVRDFAEWSKSMASEFGDYVKPHLQQIFDASIKGENAKLPKSPEQKTSIKKAVKNMTVGERQNRIEASIKKKFAAGDKDAITSDVQRLARALVEGGIKDREALINAVHGVLKNIDPTITRRDAMDAISGYGDFKQLSKDEVSVRLRGMKGEMQQIAKLQDMAKGVPPSKTGIERRTPTDEERKLIRAVNESKIKFQVPITDPATQLKSALDTRKIQLQRQIEAMQEKMASGDFSKPPRREIVLDRRAQELQAEKERVAKKFKRQQADYQKANAKNSSKILDFISNLRRFAVLSGVNVVGKLAAYSATKIPTIGATEAIGGALGKAPVLRKAFEKAPSEGGFQLKNMTNALAKGLTQGIMDAYKTARHGQSDLRAAFSNRPESGHEWYNFFQTIHEVIKSPLRRTAFELSLAKRMEFAAKHGADISDPMVQLALSKDAYLDSDRALLLENNRVANSIRGVFKQWEAVDKNTGRVPLRGKIGATIGRVELPILSVPLNYVKQALTSAFGLVSGSVKLRAAFRDGIENLKPEEADAIARHLKYGTIGGAALLWGFIDGYKNGANGTFGGFYQPGEKRKDNQAGVGGIRVAGHNIPGLLLHNPVIAVANMGHMMGAILASKVNKKSDQTHSLPVAAAAGLMGLLNQSPLGNVVEGASQLSDPRSAEWAMGEHVKGLVDPQLSQEIAQWMDKNAQGKVIKRDPKTITQHVETGIPVLRKNVPEKAKQ